MTAGSSVPEAAERRHCDLYEGLHGPHTHQEVRPVYFCDGRPPEPCADSEPHEAHAYRTRDDGWQRERDCPGIAAAVAEERATTGRRDALLQRALLRGGQSAEIRCQDALRILFPPDGRPPSDWALDHLRAALASPGEGE